MQRLPPVIAALFALLLPAVRAADWKPAAGPLMTRWAKDVSPQKALPEYPRPQMVRKDWLNLNGLWDIKLAGGTQTKILVPYPIESALSGVMKHADRMTYRRRFEIPQGWSGRHVLLHFGAVDWEAKVSVNGKELGRHRGGYDDFSFDVTDALKTSGQQEITVEVFDPTDAGAQPRGKQVLHPGGIMYTPTSGIWQTVWLEPVARTHVESLLLVPDVDARMFAFDGGRQGNGGGGRNRQRRAGRQSHRRRRRRAEARHPRPQALVAGLAAFIRSERVPEIRRHDGGRSDQLLRHAQDRAGQGR